MKKNILLLIALFFIYIINVYSKNSPSYQQCVFSISIKSLSAQKLQRSVIEILKLNSQKIPSQYEVIKKITLNKNFFEFNIKADDPFFGMIRLKIGDSITVKSSPIIISNELIKVQFDIKKEEVIVKSFQNDFYDENRLLLFSTPYEIYSDKNYFAGLVKKFYALPEPWTLGMLGFRLKEYESNVIKGVKKFRQYYHALDRFYQIRETLSPKTIDICYNVFRTTFPNTSKIKMLWEYIQKSKELKIGKKIPNLAVQDIYKNTVSISNDDFLEYEYTILDFGASWCVACRKQIKDFKKIYYEADVSTPKNRAV